MHKLKRKQKNGRTIQRHRKNRTEDKERRHAKQRNTTQKTKKDEGNAYGPHQKTKKTKKNPFRKKRDLVAFASVAELCPENHYCTGRKSSNFLNGMLTIRKSSYHVRNKIRLINNQFLFKRYTELFCITFMFLYRSEISV